MTQTMRDKLQAMKGVLRLHANVLQVEGMDFAQEEIEAVISQLESILATEPPAVTVRAGWRPIAEYDVMDRKPTNAIFWAAATQSGRNILPARVFTERLCGFRTVTHFMLIDAPNGGPECVMEVK